MTDILTILERDGRSWKKPSDLLEYGTSYTQKINKMRREQGYIIEDRWTGKAGGTKEYKLIATPGEYNVYQYFNKSEVYTTHEFSFDEAKNYNYYEQNQRIKTNRKKTTRTHRRAGKRQAQ